MSNKIRHLYEFGGFRFDVGTLCLRHDTKEVHLPLKSLETLKVLLENRGEVIEREFLLQKIWADSFVEDSNLTVTVSHLRKTLAAYEKETVFVETLPKRGYRFTNEVREIVEEIEAPLIVEKHTLKRLTIETNDSAELSVDPKFLPKQKRNRVIFLLTTVVCLFLISGGVWWKGLPETGGKINSLAVLPLKNLTETEETKPFSLGLTDNLINRLGSLNRFTVRPFSAVAKYDEAGKDAVKFGEELKVDAVLEGTIQTVENRLRVSVRLISVKDGAQLWEGNFIETEADILKLQDKLSNQVAKSLLTRLTQNETEKLNEVLTNNADAYEMFLKGRYFAGKRKGEDLIQAITYFEKAVELDKNFAEAYVSLADAQFLMLDYRWDTSDENAKSAKKNLLKALSIKPNLANAYHLLGLIQTTYEWDWEAAEKSFQKSLEIEPNSSQALHRYGVLYIILRKFPEAQEKLAKARELDPQAVSINMNYGTALVFGKDLEQAEIQIKQTLELDPKFIHARWLLGRCFWQQGRKNVAVAEFIKALEDYGQTEIAQKMRENQGDVKEKIQIWYDEWKILWDEGYADGHNMAFVSAFLDDKELTLKWLEKSVENHDNWAAWINSEPEFDFVRDDVRFTALIKKLSNGKK